MPEKRHAAETSETPVADLRRAVHVAGPRLGVFGREIRILEEVGSTNDVALRLAEAGAPEGTAVVADRQTAGRGRRGRQWFSPSGAGLYVSIVFRPPDLERLTLLAAVAAAEALDEVAGLLPEIKWPNDLILREGSRRRKLGGILAESSAAGRTLEYVVVGLGINLRPAAYPPDLADLAVSVEAATGQVVDRGAMLVALLAALGRWRETVGAAGPGALLARWRDLAPTSEGALVEFDRPGGRCRGMTAGIDEDGALLIRVGSQLERLVSAELAWL